MFANTYALVTGGSSGIGRAVAILLARQGAHVGILARNPQRLAEALQAIRSEASHADQELESFQADLRDADAVRAVVDGIESRGRPIDLLVNAAGYARPGYVQELPLEVFRDMMETNYFGTVHTTLAVVPYMIRRRRGHIVNFSSMGGLVAVFGYTAYCPSKFAVRGFSEALGSELRPYGIHVSVVYPPNTDTPGFAVENQTKPFETVHVEGTAGLMQPEEVAQAVLRGIARKKIMIIPGLESRLLYAGSNLLGAGIHVFMDYLVRRAQAAKARLGERRG
ncbi:MAG: SDR family oxidoreductase [Anaerolineae bacterium]